MSSPEKTYILESIDRMQALIADMPSGYYTEDEDLESDSPEDGAAYQAGWVHRELVKLKVFVEASQ